MDNLLFQRGYFIQHLKRKVSKCKKVQMFCLWTMLLHSAIYYQFIYDKELYTATFNVLNIQSLLKYAKLKINPFPITSITTQMI